MTDNLTQTQTYSAESCCVRPGEGEKVDSGMTLKIRAQDMEGYFSMMEGCLQGKQLRGGAAERGSWTRGAAPPDGSASRKWP